jgi:hypothetical protein
MKTGHLTEAETVDAAWGESGSPETGAHLAGCSLCAERVAAIRAAGALVEEDEQPDPGEVFWRAQLTRTMARIEDDARARRRTRKARAIWSLAAAATLLLATTIAIRGTYAPRVASPLPAWAPLAAEEEDPGFGLVAELVPAAEEISPEDEMSASAIAVEELTAEEQRTLMDALRVELGRES